MREKEVPSEGTAWTKVLAKWLRSWKEFRGTSIELQGEVERG